MKTETPAPLNEKNRRRVRVGRSSAGLGLFANDTFKKDERIIEYIGKRLTSAQVEEIVENRYLLEVNDRYTINGSARSNIARYANHACKPNAYAEAIRGRVYLIAKKTIRGGDEITWNYGREYFKDFIKDGGCRCASCVPKENDTKVAS